MDKIIQEIRSQLKKNSSKKEQESGKRFFKEEIDLYGIRTATVIKMEKEAYAKIKDMNKKEIFDLCEELWKSGLLEETFIACNWSYNMHKHYEVGDIKVFEKWISKYINNWASCDTFCNHTVGTYLEKYPKSLPTLKKWAVSKNKWVRRAAAVSLIVPARKGKFRKEAFEIADILLTDSEDMVQKGYGWLLKVTSQSDQKSVFDYVMKNKKFMPRTALRYAIEKMPQDLRKAAMAR